MDSDGDFCILQTKCRDVPSGEELCVVRSTLIPEKNITQDKDVCSAGHSGVGITSQFLMDLYLEIILSIADVQRSKIPEQKDLFLEGFLVQILEETAEGEKQVLA
ncbi:hypothetical protein STEG23_013127 [Scotinomys teguina]